MRLSGLLTAVLTLAIPARARAQSVTREALIGSWAREGEKEMRLMFRADSTATARIETTQGPGTAHGRWHLAGDTLVFDGLKGKADATGQQISIHPDRRVVSFEGKKLKLTLVNGQEKGPTERRYERLDSLVANTTKP